MFHTCINFFSPRPVVGVAVFQHLWCCPYFVMNIRYVIRSREATMNAQIPANLVYLRYFLKPVTCLLWHSKLKFILFVRIWCQLFISLNIWCTARNSLSFYDTELELENDLYKSLLVSWYFVSGYSKVLLKILFHFM